MVTRRKLPVARGVSQQAFFHRSQYLPRRNGILRPYSLSSYTEDYALGTRSVLCWTCLGWLATFRPAAAADLFLLHLVRVHLSRLLLPPGPGSSLPPT